MELLFCITALAYFAGMALILLAMRPSKDGLYPLVANRPWLGPVLRVSWGVLVPSVASLMLQSYTPWQHLLFALSALMILTCAEIVAAGAIRVSRSYFSRTMD